MSNFIPEQSTSEGKVIRCVFEEFGQVDDFGNSSNKTKKIFSNLEKTLYMTESIKILTLASMPFFVYDGSIKSVLLSASYLTFAIDFGYKYFKE